MNSIYLAYYVIKRNLKDIKSMAMMLFLPIVLIFILGNALSGEYSLKNLKKTKVAYLNQDTGKISQSFNYFLKEKGVKEVLEAKEVETYEEGVRLVNVGKVDGVIVIDKEYSKNIIQGKKAIINVYSKKQGSIREGIIKNVVDSYVNSANTIEAVYKIKGSIENYKEGTGIEETSISIDGKMPSSLDYYGVTMLVMILMYGCMYGFYGIKQNYFDNLGKRIKSAPIRTYEIFIGFSIGTVLTIFLQGFVMILFTKYFYRVNWGENIGIILFVNFSLSVLSTVLGIFAATLNEKIGDGVLNLIVPIFTFISGGYFKFNIDSKIYEGIQNIIPNALAQNAIFNTIYAGDSVKVTNSIITIWIITIILFIAAIIAGRKVRV